MGSVIRLGTLDDPAAMAKIDRGGLLAVMNAYVDDFVASLKRGLAAEVNPPKDFQNVVISGMGGSGIGGTITKSLVRDSSPVPVDVVKDYHVPSYVGARSVVIAVSYSGNTEETLSCALEARARGAYLIGISSGGLLERTAKAPGRLHVPVPGGYQPRAALGHLFGSLLGVATRLRLADFRLDRPFEREVRTAHKAFLPAAPESKNPAKQFARDLHERFPVWYAGPPLGPVALRGRCQLNENAKVPAGSHELPEANHNDLVPLAALDKGERYFLGILRQHQEPPEIRHRFEFLESTLQRRRVPHREYVTRASLPVGRVLEGLLLVDYVSVYAAILRGVDPTPVDVITDLKRLLGKKGLAPRLEPRAA